MNKIEKLNKSDFYDVYGISLLEKNHVEENNYLLALLLPIARKYINITTYALRAECRYYFSQCDFYSFTHAKRKNLKLLEKRKIEPKYGYRKKLTLNIMLDMFNKGSWSIGYGGHAWGEICKTCIDLKREVDTLNLRRILLYIDRLNDLEHNNALYLRSYSTFNLEEALLQKGYSYTCEEDIFKECSSDIQKLTKGIKLYE
jgi:hypothetical protein